MWGRKGRKVEAASAFDLDDFYLPSVDVIAADDPGAANGVVSTSATRMLVR